MLFPHGLELACRSEISGPSRVMGDIGSHWFDMIEHLTGLRVTVVVRRSADVSHNAQEAKEAAWRHLPESWRVRKMWMTFRLTTEDFRNGDLSAGRQSSRRYDGEPGFCRPKNGFNVRDLRDEVIGSPGTRNVRTSFGSDTGMTRIRSSSKILRCCLTGRELMRTCLAGIAKDTTIPSSRSSGGSISRLPILGLRWSIRRSRTACGR